MSIELIKKLRNETSATILEAKLALQQAEGDYDKAVKNLRENGINGGSGSVSISNSYGKIYSYIHPGSRIGVLLELSCDSNETAQCDEFELLAKNIALHIAAVPFKNIYMTRNDVPEEIINDEKEIIVRQSKGKPENVIEKIIRGRMEKFYAQIVLLEQPFVKDNDITIKDLLDVLSKKTGERIRLRRFQRFVLGD